MPRSSQRYVGTEREREEELLSRIRALARENPRYGCRRIKALLVREGWSVNLKRVHRLWRREGLKVDFPTNNEHRVNGYPARSYSTGDL